MDDQQLAAALMGAGNLDALVRAHEDASGDDVRERDAARLVRRHMTAVKRALEQWIGSRAMRTIDEVVQAQKQ
jgi:hypothetical protein